MAASGSLIIKLHTRTSPQEPKLHSEVCCWPGQGRMMVKIRKVGTGKVDNYDVPSISGRVYYGSSRGSGTVDYCIHNSICRNSNDYTVQCAPDLAQLFATGKYNNNVSYSLPIDPWDRKGCELMPLFHWVSYKAAK